MHRPSVPAEQHKRSWFPASAVDTSYTGKAGALNVLIVEDDDPVRDACASYAQSVGCRVRAVSSLADAKPLLTGSSPDLVLLDLFLPDGSGATLLEQLRRDHPRAMITVMSAQATVTLAMDMISKGAAHVLEKPFTLTQIGATLERAAHRREASASTRALLDQLEAGIAPGQLVARSAGMHAVLKMVSRVATTRSPLLITGEPGCGKETVARTIHANSALSLHPFVPVDCDALDNRRLEAELFGDPESFDPYRQEGLLATIAEGTLCLGEVGTMAPALQARLVRVLESKQIHRATAGPALPFRARVVACTSQELEKEMQHGRFRRDLFHKLSTTHLRIPPLRERAEDLPGLAEGFLEAERRQRGIHFVFSEHASGSMLRYPWPGNVAELEATIIRACTHAAGPVVHFDDLGSPVRNFEPPGEPQMPISAEAFLTLEEREREAILSAMHIASDDKAVAARLLGIGKTTLYRKLKEYSLEPKESGLEQRERSSERKERSHVQDAH